jgi:hypothetical protein
MSGFGFIETQAMIPSFTSTYLALWESGAQVARAAIPLY